MLYLRSYWKGMREKTIDYALRSTWMAVAKMYNEEASKKGSTMATGFALISIDPEIGTPSTALGPMMGIESTSLSRTLKTMEKKGLIYRCQNPDDGRSVLVHLTSFGVEMRNFSKGVILAFDHAVRAHIPQKKLDVFLEVFEMIHDLIASKKIYNK